MPYILALYCNAFLSAQCELAKLSNSLSQIHTAYPALMNEAVYQGLMSNTQMLLTHNEILTAPIPFSYGDDSYIKPVDPRGVVVPDTSVERPATPIVILGFDGNPMSSY